MIIRQLLPLALIFTALAPLHAGTAVATPAATTVAPVEKPSAEKLKLAEEYLETSGAKKTYEAYIGTTEENYAEAVKNMPEEQREKTLRIGRRISDLMKKEMGWDAIKVENIEAVATVYTEEELRALIAFNKTPAGKSIAEKSPVMQKQNTTMFAKHMIALQPKITAITMEEYNLNANGPSSISLAGESTGAESTADPKSEKTSAALTRIRATAVEKTVINDARQIASASQQYMAENATDYAPVSEIRKFLSGGKLSSGVKFSVFDAAKPGEVKLIDFDSAEAAKINLRSSGAFVLGHEKLDTTATNSRLKNNKSTTAGTAAFSVETGAVLTK